MFHEPCSPFSICHVPCTPLTSPPSWGCRMVRLNTRVETIHELLEKLLDDDNDMKDMNLSVKQQVGTSAKLCTAP